jgi:hypothetical protein
LAPKLPEPLHFQNGSTPFIFLDPVTLIQIKAFSVLFKDVH